MAGSGDDKEENNINICNSDSKLIQRPKNKGSEMETVNLNEMDTRKESTPLTLKIDNIILDEVPRCNEFQRTSNIPESIFNLVNSIIGGGIIGLAYSFTTAGMPLGIIMLILSGIVTDLSIILLIKCGLMSERYTYQGVAEASFGKPGLIIVSIAQFVFPVTAMMAYGVAISDNMALVFARTVGEGTIASNRQFINGIATLLIMLPLSLPRNIALLDKFSALSIVCVLFYSLVIIVRAGTLAHLTTPAPNSWNFAKAGFPQAIGVMAFAFGCLHNVFPLYRVLQNTSVKRYSIVVHSSVIISTAFYIAVALAGYITFTSLSQGNLLNNFCPNDDIANAARFIFALTIILTYPFQVFISREVLEVGFFRHYKKSVVRHVVITILIIGAATSVSMATDCLGLVLQLAGCFSASPLLFIFPPLMYMKLRGEGMLKLRYTFLWFLVVFGFAVMILGTVMAISSHSGSCSFRVTERYWCGISHENQTLTNSTAAVLSSTSIPETIVQSFNNSEYH